MTACAGGQRTGIGDSRSPNSRRLHSPLDGLDHDVHLLVREHGIAGEVEMLLEPEALRNRAFADTVTLSTPLRQEMQREISELHFDAEVLKRARDERSRQSSLGRHEEGIEVIGGF